MRSWALAQIATRRRVVMARSPAQDAYIRAMDTSELVFGVGPAGTGKTYALAGLVTRYVAEGAATLDQMLLIAFSRAATRELTVRAPSATALRPKHDSRQQLRK